MDGAFLSGPTALDVSGGANFKDSAGDTMATPSDAAMASTSPTGICASARFPLRYFSPGTGGAAPFRRSTKTFTSVRLSVTHLSLATGWEAFVSGSIGTAPASRNVGAEAPKSGTQSVEANSARTALIDSSAFAYSLSF